MIWTLRIACTGLVVAGTAWATPERPTFTKDVLPILQENCQTCHRPAGANLSGMIAPMSLTTYDEVRPWVKAIRRVVEARQMPPWQASDLTRGHFRNERTLSQDQINTILAWIDQGAVRGNPADAPPPLEYPESGWTIGEPDLVVGFDEPYWVADEIEDIQPFILVTLKPDQLTEPKWVSAIEFKPGSEVVHHIVTFIAAPGASFDPENQKLFGLIAPGTDPQRFDEGYGIRLDPETTVGFAMHYHKETGPGTGVWDTSLMALKFHDKPVQHPLEIAPITYGWFEVPPYHPRWKVGAAYTFEEDTIILQFMPHTHLRGSAARYTAYYPDGTSEILLDVPNYDYNWQTGYDYKTYKRIPAGTRVEWEVHYDNSPAQAEKAGFDPSVAVRFGGPTTDEMDLGWITYALAEPHREPPRIPTEVPQENLQVN